LSDFLGFFEKNKTNVFKSYWVSIYQGLLGGLSLERFYQSLVVSKRTIQTSTVLVIERMALSALRVA
jgi:hypothetical protein